MHNFTEEDLVAKITGMVFVAKDVPYEQGQVRVLDPLYQRIFGSTVRLALGIESNEQYAGMYLNMENTLHLVQRGEPLPEPQLLPEDIGMKDIVESYPFRFNAREPELIEAVARLTYGQHAT